MLAELSRATCADRIVAHETRRILFIYKVRFAERRLSEFRANCKTLGFVALRTKAGSLERRTLS
jgi:hypothetical protein